MPKTVRILVTLLITNLLGGVFFAGCSHVRYLLLSPEPPKASVTQIQIKGVGIGSIKAVATLSIHNPNDFSLDAQQLRYEVFAHEKSVATGSIQKPWVVPPLKDKRVSLPIVIRTASAAEAIALFFQKGQIEIRVIGQVIFSTPLGKITTDIDQTRQIEG